MQSAAEVDFHVMHDRAGREFQHVVKIEAGLEFHIVDHAGGAVVKVAVFLQIRAVAGGFALEIDLLDQAILDQHFQAVVHGGQRDAGQVVLHPQEDVRRGGMVAVGQQHLINLLPLASHAQPAGVVGSRGFGIFLGSARKHGGGKLRREGMIARIILKNIFSCQRRGKVDHRPCRNRP